MAATCVASDWASQGPSRAPGRRLEASGRALPLAHEMHRVVNNVSSIVGGSRNSRRPAMMTVEFVLGASLAFLLGVQGIRTD